MKKSIKDIVNLLFEIGILNKTPRSGFHFLGSGQQSVAEHINRVVYIGYMLAMLEKGVDCSRVMKMCLFHDLGETRTSDLNYVHQKYNQPDEYKAIKDIADSLPFGQEMVKIIDEYKEAKTKEAILARDADQLEFLLSLKEQVDTGNKKAESWIPPVSKRLKSQIAKEVAEEILKTDSDQWWFADKKDKWWSKKHKEL